VTDQDEVALVSRLIDEAEALRLADRDSDALVRIQQAIAIVDQLDFNPETPRYLLSQEAELLESLGDLEGAVKALSRLADGTDDDLALRRSALLYGSVLAERVGDSERALSMALELTARQRGTARDEVAACVAGLARAAEICRGRGEFARAIALVGDLERLFDACGEA
jgi:tetratricopeptide (TPR) repeat protein